MSGMAEGHDRYARSLKPRALDRGVVHFLPCENLGGPDLVLEGIVPVCLIEAKLGDEKISAHGRYFAARLGIPFHQIVLNADAAEAFPGNCFLLPATVFFMVSG